MELPFVTVDVFTKTRYRGNPLAVVTIPASPSPQPTQEQKQAVAREFNLSETVFIHDAPEGDPSKERRIDIFLPTREIPFAGHPTVGTAVSLLSKGVTRLLAKAGPLEIVKTGDDSVRAGIPYELRLHAKKLKDIPNAESTPDAEVSRAELDAPVFSIVNGMTFILVELPSLEALAKAEHRHCPNDELCDKGWGGGFMSKYHFVRTSEAETDENGAQVLNLRTRMLEGSFEDPATGSAACCLCSYLSTVTETSNAHQQFRYQLTQGVEMGKESSITVEIVMKDNKVDKVYLAGSAVQVMRGHVQI